DAAVGVEGAAVGSVGDVRVVVGDLVERHGRGDLTVDAGAGEGAGGGGGARPADRTGSAASSSAAIRKILWVLIEPASRSPFGSQPRPEGCSSAISRTTWPLGSTAT